MDSRSEEIGSPEEDREREAVSSIVDQYWNQTVRSSLALAFGAISLAFSTGCYTNQGIKHPDPDFNRRQEMKETSEEFEKYMVDLTEDIDINEEPLYNKEEKFHRYLEFLEEVAGAEIDEEDFDIISDNPITALGDTDPLIALFLPENAGIYWHGQAIVSNNHLSPEAVTHEIGHSLDPYLSSKDWLLSYKERVRMEATAHAFEHYVGLELMSRGEPVGKDHLIGLYLIPNDNEPPLRPSTLKGDLEDVTSMEEMMEGDEYITEKGLVTLIMREEKSAGKVWEYLTTHNTEEVYDRVEDIIEDTGGFEAARAVGLYEIRTGINESLIYLEEGE